MVKEITVTEAARRAGVTVGRIRQLLGQGRIAGARKLGRDWLIPEGATIKQLPPQPRASPGITEIPRAKGSGKKRKTQ